MRAYVCPNIDCREYGKPKLVDRDTQLAQDQADGVITGPVVCGTCGTPIPDPDPADSTPEEAPHA